MTSEFLMNYKILVFITLSLVTIVHANAYQVIDIADGDTMSVLVNNKPVRIRLANIDAPEKKQAFGQRSKESLSELCWGKDAQYETQSIDRYKRTVAIVTCGNTGVNREQVRRGMAWVYTKYNQDPFQIAIQESAQEKKRGLWADAHPVPPWEFRQAAKSKKSTLFSRSGQ
jgi:micrococcal nuclease